MNILTQHWKIGLLGGIVGALVSPLTIDADFLSIKYFLGGLASYIGAVVTFELLTIEVPSA